MSLVEFRWAPFICEMCESCICQTLVEYRKESESVYTTPASAPNPTKDGLYNLTLEDNVNYLIKLTHMGPRCKKRSQIIPYKVTTQICCNSGETLSTDGAWCIRVLDVNATPPAGSPVTLTVATNGAYSTCGSFIYQLGYALNGTGTSSKIMNPSDLTQPSPFWTNGIGDCGGSNGTTLGPLNRTGVWAGAPQDNQDVGFGVCIDAPEAKIYYIGVAADNYSAIDVDEIHIVAQNPSALGTQYGIGEAATFKIWHIYPVMLSAGSHIIKILGHNISSNASMGCEVYNATEAELKAATSYADLGAKLIFSSKDERGQTVQIGTGGVGYTCPENYTLATCTEPVKCRRVIRTLPHSC